MLPVLITPPPFNIFSDDLVLLKKKKLHVVCPAILRPSNCITYLVDHLQMSEQRAITLIKKVEVAKEPGCLHPDHTFTIFPTHGSGANLKYCINETLKANEEYFKTDTLLFAFDPGAWPDMQEVQLCLQDSIVRWLTEGRLTYLKNCYF